MVRKVAVHHSTSDVTVSLLYNVTTNVCTSIFVYLAYPNRDCDPDDSVRLINRNSLRDGTLEICQDGQWGALCYDEVNKFNQAGVACRDLGFSPEGNALSCTYTYT